MKKITLQLEVYDAIPKEFDSQVQIAACYLEIDNKLLLLQQSHRKLEPGKWGVPAGKLENNEAPEDAAIRELLEETGIFIKSSSQMQYISPLYIRKPDFDYVYHVFKVRLNLMPEVCLSNEHQNYMWARSKDIETLILMDGAKEALQHYQCMSTKGSDQ